MTPEDHQAEHVRLHRALDELLACYLGENRFANRRTSIHDEIFSLMKWAYQMSLVPSPAPEEVQAHKPLPDFLIAQNDDGELLEWLAKAETEGGGFVKAIAHAGLSADSENYPMVRPLLLAMRRKYPAYEPSDAVKQEIRERQP